MVLRDRMHYKFRKSNWQMTKMPCLHCTAKATPQQNLTISKGGPAFPTVSGCWPRYMHNLGGNSLRFRLLLFKANFSKQRIIYIFNGRWNSTPILRKRDKQGFCTGQKKWRKELTVYLSCSTSELERIAERLSSHKEKQSTTQEWFLYHFWFTYLY